MNGIKAKNIFYAVVFLLGIVIYCFLTRYEIVVAGADTAQAYKIDRITGNVEYAMAIQWFTMGEAKK